jgi:CheY-like chemotaxis protein
MKRNMAGVTTDLARVLLVDDKADIRSIVATRLRLEPVFDVVGEAANGAEAIARVGELKPQVMILDLQMPVMSGEEVIPVLRSLAPQLRILVFSAYAGAQQHLRGCERPDAEVRKGTGLGPLVAELYRLLDQAPCDLVDVDLGTLDTECALRATRAWARLNPSVRETAVERGARSDFLALVGVFLALSEPLKRAARSRWATSPVGFSTRLEAGRAARRALAAIGEAEAALLEPLRSPLLAGLPAAGASG